MTTMRAVRAGAAAVPSKADGRLALWLGGLTLALGLLAAPFATGDRALLQWTWPLGAGLLFLSVRGIGATIDGRFGARAQASREDAVGPWLERLGGKAHVLRYVAAGGRSLEYVIVAPSGVYSMRTRGHRGKVAARAGELIVSGRPLPPEVLAASRSEAYALEQRLASLGFGYPVKPLLVFTEAWTDVRSVGEVVTLPVRWLESFVRRSPGQMSPLETALVAGALRRDARATTVR